MHINASSLPVLFTSKSEIARKVLSFIHFTHGFLSLNGSELTYFWKLCQARRQQLTFFNQAWEIGPQAWAGVRSQFSTRRRETHALGVRVGRYNKILSKNPFVHNNKNASITRNTTSDKRFPFLNFQASPRVVVWILSNNFELLLLPQ